MQERNGKQLELFDTPVEEATPEDYKVYDAIASETIMWLDCLTRIENERKAQIQAERRSAFLPL